MQNNDHQQEQSKSSLDMNDRLPVQFGKRPLEPSNEDISEHLSRAKRTTLTYSALPPLPTSTTDLGESSEDGSNKEEESEDSMGKDDIFPVTHEVVLKGHTKANQQFLFAKS